MSWNWNSDIEEREYETKGAVTIGTDEYRDLIKDVCDLRSAGQKEHDDWYREYNRANDLERKLRECEKKLAEINGFFDSDDSVRTKYKLWKIEQEESEEGE